MRYYSVAITKSDGKTPYLFKSLNGQTLSSLIPSGSQDPRYGTTNPGALQVEFDIAVFNGAAPDNSSLLRVWGLGIQDIGQAANLNGCNITISAGMARGLPLANPKQAGVIMKGQIFQAFGNWVGTEQTVDMIFVAGGVAAGSSSAPSNFPFIWQANTPLSTAIANTLKIALPGFTQNINISEKLTINYTMTDHKQSLQQFSDFIQGVSQSLIGGDYPGVTISLNGNVVTVDDGTVMVVTGQIIIAIQPADLIGQPTWLSPGVISVKTILRSDISVSTKVTLPKTLITTTSASFQSLQDNSTFSGQYQVQQLHQYGNYRQPSADAWNTTLQLTPVATASES
jgi:hypothetical protein